MCHTHTPCVSRVFLFRKRRTSRIYGISSNEMVIYVEISQYPPGTRSVTSPRFGMPQEKSFAAPWSIAPKGRQMPQLRANALATLWQGDSNGRLQCHQMVTCMKHGHTKVVTPVVGRMLGPLPLARHCEEEMFGIFAS